MNHYVYKLTDKNTNEFYIGSRSCECTPIDDVYMGSMKSWNPMKENLVKEILKINFNSRESAINFESKIISDNIDNPLNRNYHIPTNGFHTHGMLWDIESKKKLSDIRIKNKLAVGENNPMYGKTHSSETLKKQKEKAKDRYTLNWFIERYGEDVGSVKYNYRCSLHSKRNSGTGNPMFNKLHTKLSKQKMSDSSKKKVGKFDLENNLLYTYSSINEASVDVNISISSISAVCSPKRINKTAGGFIWKFI